MLSVSILNMYATQFESLVKVPKRANKIKSSAKNEAIEVKNEATENRDKKPQINYFAGPHCVFNPQIK